MLAAKRAGSASIEKLLKFLKLFILYKPQNQRLNYRTGCLLLANIFKEAPIDCTSELLRCVSRFTLLVGLIGISLKKYTKNLRFLVYRNNNVLAVRQLRMLRRVRAAFFYRYYRQAGCFVSGMLQSQQWFFRRSCHRPGLD